MSYLPKWKMLVESALKKVIHEHNKTPIVNGSLDFYDLVAVELAKDAGNFISCAKRGRKSLDRSAWVCAVNKVKAS